MSEGAGLPVQVGDFIAAKYRVERVLGAGAMGVVVAAMHLDLQEVRAIKLMLPSALSDAEAVERFLREARAAARLKSDNVAKIYDVGRLETGSPYIVLELLEGVDLKTVLDRESTLSAERAARYVAQACDAVGEAHTLGIVHRDLKPANLFLTTGPRGEERVKVLDFGIAKMADPAAAGVEMTRTTMILGTPLYMSPEQMRGARNADARSDVWALGVVLYRMLTGRVPFLGSTITEVCSAVISDVPEPPRAVRSDLPPGLEAVILRCLGKKPADRFANANELGAALAPFATGTAAVAMPEATGSTLAMSSPAVSASPAVASAAVAPTAFGPPQVYGAPPGVGLPPVPPPAPPGASTTQSTAWAQSGASSSGAFLPASTGIVAPKPVSRVPLAIGAVVVLALFLGGAGWAASRFLFSTPAESSAPVAEATSAAATIAAAAAASASAAAPLVEPAASASASAIPVATATAAVPGTTAEPVPSSMKPAPGATTKAPPPVKPREAAKNCNPPYVIDSAGRRRMKPECL